MKVKDAKVGRRSLKGRKVYYYLRCTRCGTEFNVSPYMELDGAYICPDCEEVEHGTLHAGRAG